MPPVLAQVTARALAPALAPVLRFGRFELRTTERTLWQQGQALPLGSRALDVLVALVSHQGDLVTKETLLNTAWPGLVVEEANVHVAVSQLRKLLGKAAISTVGGLGYRFALPVQAEAAAAPEPHRAAPNLPQPRTAFVGRQAELAEAAALLQHTRLLTVVAMGGMGKTRLALQLAHTLQSRYADGVVFVDLQPLQAGLGGAGDVGSVLAAMARALGLPAAASTAQAATTTAQMLHLQQHPVLLHLQQRPLLLMLNNCEHLLPAVQLVLQQLLLSLSPPMSPPLSPHSGATVLATSRQALDLPGERIFALRPLQVPSAGSAATSAGPSAPASEAVQLFMQRVLADTPGFATDAATSPLVADICRRLDGIPLALELAAARMKMLSLQQLHSLLAQRFELLSRSSPGTGNRQQTLQDVLQWSHDHLAAPEQTLAQAVAVCSGGFDMDAAVALVGCAGLAPEAAPAEWAAETIAFESPVAVLDSLAQLADRALIHVTHGGATARYGLLETVREYLLAQLSRSGQLHAVRQRHLQHFHALALQAEAATTAQNSGPGAGPTTDAARWAARLDAERDNLLSALAWCHCHGSAQTGLEMVAALKNFWFASGWLEQGLQAAGAALARVPAGQPTLLSARVQRLAAQLCLFMQRLEEGALHARQALAQSQALGDEAGAAAALCFAGRIAVKSEDTASGEQLLQEGLRRARQAQALSVVGEALNALAFAAIERNDLDAAEAHFGEALLASQQRGSALGSVIETLNLAWVSVMNAVKKARPATELERARQLLLSVWHTLQHMPHRYVAQELIDVCASFALHRGAHEEAALLHAASAAQRQAIQLPLTANQAARRAAEAAAVRAALGDPVYEAAATAGRALPHDQTLARVGGWLRVGPAAAGGAAVVSASERGPAPSTPVALATATAPTKVTATASTTAPATLAGTALRGGATRTRRKPTQPV